MIPTYHMKKYTLIFGLILVVVACIPLGAKANYETNEFNAVILPQKMDAYYFHSQKDCFANAAHAVSNSLCANDYHLDTSFQKMTEQYDRASKTASESQDSFLAVIAVPPFGDVDATCMKASTWRLSFMDETSEDPAYIRSGFTREGCLPDYAEDDVNVTSPPFPKDAAGSLDLSTYFGGYTYDGGIRLQLEPHSKVAVHSYRSLVFVPKTGFENTSYDVTVSVVVNSLTYAPNDGQPNCATNPDPEVTVGGANFPIVEWDGGSFCGRPVKCPDISIAGKVSAVPSSSTYQGSDCKVTFQVKGKSEIDVTPKSSSSLYKYAVGIDSITKSSPSVSSASPSQNVTWQAGVPQTITWNAPNVSRVTIFLAQLSFAGNIIKGSQISLAQNISNTESYTWIPDSSLATDPNGNPVFYSLFISNAEKSDDPALASTHTGMIKIITTPTPQSLPLLTRPQAPFLQAQLQLPHLPQLPLRLLRQ